MADKWSEARVADALSPERLAPYLCAAGGDRTTALRLYEWNLAADGRYIYRLLGWINTDVRTWAETPSRLQAVIAVRPRQHHSTCPVAIRPRENASGRAA
ncbi:MAG: hypothetical protein LBR32_04580 [Propionibacteriaceae bacterium]|jgi:hypothetical protein|nr:hypothetical protein [Propionibacteriaceae bacterium]